MCSQFIVTTAILVAKSFKGKAILFQIIAGSGIIKNKYATGIRVALANSKPNRNTIRLQMKISMEKRMVKSSAPMYATRNTERPANRIMRPAFDGRTGIFEIFSLRYQTR